VSPANTNTSILHQPRYIGANWLGVHKVAIGDAVAMFWSEADALAAVEKIGTMRTAGRRP